MKVNFEELEVLADNLFLPLASLKDVFQGFEGASANMRILPEELDDALTGSETKELTSAISGLKLFLPSLEQESTSFGVYLGHLEKEVITLKMAIKQLKEKPILVKKIEAYQLERLLELFMLDMSVSDLRSVDMGMRTKLGGVNPFGQQLDNAMKASEAKNDKLSLALISVNRELSVFWTGLPIFRNSIGRLEGTLKQIHAKIEEMPK